MNIIDSLLSINFSSDREGHNIKNIILHTMSSTVSGIDELFRNPDSKVSLHYGIGLNGDITRWVQEADTALQTDNIPANIQSIGITHEDNANPNDSVRTDAMYNASAELIADLCHRYDVPCKLVEVDGNHMPVESGIVLHSPVSLSQTACPFALDGNRIVSQAQAILEPPEAPKPVDYELLPAPKKMRIRDMANGGAELWDLSFQTWADVKSVQHLDAGDEFDAVAVAHHPLGGEYYMTEADYNDFGRSNVPFRPWGANVDDLEDYPVDTTSQEQQSEQVAQVEADPQPPVEHPSAKPSEQPSDSTLSKPEITYSDLPMPLPFVTKKSPTNVYDLDMDTFSKLTAVKELAEGTTFEAVKKAEIIDSGQTTIYYIDAQNQSVNNDDLTPALEDSTEQEQATIEDPPAPNDSVNQSASDSASQANNTNEEAPVDLAQLDLNKYFNYKNFPDGKRLFHAVGNTDIDDLNPVNPKPQETLQDKEPWYIQGAFTDPVTHINYYRSDTSVANGDWYAIPINAVTHDNDVDHLSSSAIDMSKKQKMLSKVGSIAGTPVGLIRDIYFKTKKG